jgi:hypothetical protein
MMLAPGAAGLWLLQWATADHPLLGHGPVQAGLHAMANPGTALLFMVACGRAILNLGLPAGVPADATEPPPLPIQRLGPHAEHRVHRAAGQAATLAELQRHVARDRGSRGPRPLPG